MGNLFTYTESIAWEDRNIDRGDDIMNLNIALLNARERGYAIYCSPDFTHLKLTWGYFFQFLWSEGKDETKRNNLFPWLSQIHYDILCRIFSSIGLTTPQKAKNFQELESEFTNVNNGLFGFRLAPIPAKYIYDCPTLFKWNSDYLIEHPELIDWQNCGHEYFAELKETIKFLDSEIERNIRKEEVPILKKKYNNDIELVFYEEIMKKQSVENRIAYAEIIGLKVANINYYKFEDKISTNESEQSKKKRRVFSTLKDGVRVFLSIDFEKGMFEILDHSGKHLGEFRFGGTKNKNADDEGNHDLKTV